MITALNNASLNINKTSGLLLGARQLCSPYCDARPLNGEGQLDLDLIVIHAISLPPRDYGHNFIDDLFCGRLDESAHSYFKDIAHLSVSSHLLVDRLGNITQYVPFHCRAWHAGVSIYKGRENCNDFSIGIELEGCDEDEFTEKQYQSLNRVLNSLLSTYPSLSAERITGHSDIAPGRKTDPGPKFDWQKVKKN